MATLPSGSISLGQVQDFFDGETDTSAASLSEYYKRTYQIPSSGTLSLNDFRGVEGYYGNRKIAFQGVTNRFNSRYDDGFAMSMPTLGSSSLFTGHGGNPVTDAGYAGVSNATYLWFSEYNISSSDVLTEIYYWISFASPGSSFGYGGTHPSNQEGLAGGCSNGVTGMWSGGAITSTFNFGSSTSYQGALWKMTLSTSGSASTTGGYLPDRNHSTGANGDDASYLLAQSNGTRGVWFSGSTTPIQARGQKIAYITITSNSNAATFGNITQPGVQTEYNGAVTTLAERAVAPAASRVILSGGEADVGAGGGWLASQKRMDYITVDTTGNSTFLGDLTKIRHSHSAGGNGSRCVWGGGSADNSSGVEQTEGSGSDNHIFYTIDYNNPFSTSNAADWGDFPNQKRSVVASYGSGSSS